MCASLKLICPWKRTAPCLDEREPQGAPNRSAKQRKLTAAVGDNTINPNGEIRSKACMAAISGNGMSAPVRVKPLAQPSRWPRALAGLDGPPMPDLTKEGMPRICPTVRPSQANGGCVPSAMALRGGGNRMGGRVARSALRELLAAACLSVARSAQRDPRRPHYVRAPLRPRSAAAPKPAPAGCSCRSPARYASKPQSNSPKPQGPKPHSPRAPNPAESRSLPLQPVRERAHRLGLRPRLQAREPVAPQRHADVERLHQALAAQRLAEQRRRQQRDARALGRGLGHRDRRVEDRAAQQRRRHARGGEPARPFVGAVRAQQRLAREVGRRAQAARDARARRPATAAARSAAAPRCRARRRRRSGWPSPGLRRRGRRGCCWSAAAGRWPDARAGTPAAAAAASRPRTCRPRPRSRPGDAGRPRTAPARRACARSCR